MIRIIAVFIVLFSNLAWAGISDDIKNLQPGYWYEIPDSKQQDVNFDWTGIYGKYPGNSNIYAYSGGAYDSMGNRLIIWGGGHGDYGGNEIYAFNFNVYGTANDYKWVRLTDPSTYDQIEACGDVDCNGYLADGEPQARHTYNHIDYSPQLNALVSIRMHAEYKTTKFKKPNFDYFDFDTDTWGKLTKNPLDDHQVMAVDTSTGDIWVVSSRNAPHYIYQWKYSTNKWIKRYQDAGTDDGYSQNEAAIDPVAKVLVILGGGHYDKFSINPDDFDRSTGYTVRIGTSNGFSGPSDLVNSNRPTLEYDPNSGLMVGWIGGTDIYTLDHSSDRFEKILAAKGNTVTPPPFPGNSGVNGRFQVIDRENLIAITTSNNSNMFVYRLGNQVAPYTPPSNTSPPPTNEPPQSSPPSSVPVSDRPVITNFVLPVSTQGLTFNVASFTATDNYGVTGYQITKTPIPPQPFGSGWSNTPPASIAEATPGVYDYYAWAKDSEGHVGQYATWTVDVATTKITVGPQGRDFDNFSDAIDYIANRGNPEGFIIEADAGVYPSWRSDCGYPSDNLKNIFQVNAPNLTVRGVGGYAHLEYLCRGDTDAERWTISPGSITHGSLIVQRSPNLRLENIELSGGCHYSSKNGAGLWIESSGIGTTIKNCYFHDNDDGILSGPVPGSTITIMNSHFYRNSHDVAQQGYHHNLYIGEVDRLIFMYNYSHSAIKGQLLKSRASKNYILYNRLTSELGNQSNYVIDLPNGGESYIIGNLLQKASDSYNDTFINYGREVTLDVRYKNGGTEALNDGKWVTNKRTSRQFKIRYNFNYGATGTWANHDRASHCDFNVVESDNPDFRVGDRLIYGSNSYVDVTSVDWTWANPTKEIYVINNTIINECSMGYGQYVIRAHPDTRVAMAQNNIIIDLNPQKELKINISDTTREKAVTEVANYWSTVDPGFVDFGNFYYALSSSATAAINQGVDPGSANEMDLTPLYQYVPNLRMEERILNGTIDIGAYEYLQGPGQSENPKAPIGLQIVSP